MKSIFDPNVARELIDRINRLSFDTKPLWGKMNAGQMLAHCVVSYDMVYTSMYKKSTGIKRIFLKYIIKKYVVSDKAYKPNGRTAPVFLQVDERDFEIEKTTLVNYINRVAADGEASFEGKESLSFGALTAIEWNNLFYKHLEHHLKQFGV